MKCYEVSHNFVIFKLFYSSVRFLSIHAHNNTDPPVNQTNQRLKDQ